MFFCSFSDSFVNVRNVIRLNIALPIKDIEDKVEFTVDLSGERERKQRDDVSEARKKRMKRIDVSTRRSAEIIL